jgi:hypothetical protein
MQFERQHQEIIFPDALIYPVSEVSVKEHVHNRSDKGKKY